MNNLAVQLKTTEKLAPGLRLIKHEDNIFSRLSLKEAKMAMVGLGYVGLPIALEFAGQFSVIGFDINDERVEMMREGIDPSNELEADAFENRDIKFTSKLSQIADAEFYVVAVPTPIDNRNEPNLTPLKKATASVAEVLKKGDFVVFESTVFPGCTEEVCVPILERISGLKYNEDFKVGYSPERINPGDKVNTVTTITKVVSGSDEEALENIANVYDSIITAGIHKAPTIKVAEASKIIENTQRDVNIALMNELSMIFNKMGINTHDVLEASGTKWNFLKFFPGLVGGHCIGVDPYYLAYKAKQVKVDPRVISSSRFRNDAMPYNIAYKISQKLEELGKRPKECKVLVKGITFKENVSDIRNSKVAEVVKKLSLFGIESWVEDPHADSDEVYNEYGIECSKKVDGIFDVVITAVAHDEYMTETAEYYNSISDENTIFYDVRGIIADKVSHGHYLSL
ncbi:MAG: nucleotide sugar dehydrogenase [Balneolaceae bacterium]